MNPSKVQARKMVLVSAFLLAAIAIYRDRRAGQGDTFRALWGVGVVSLVLSIVADFAPTIAGPFAALVVLGSLTEPGSNLIGSMLGTISVTPSPGAAAHPDSNLIGSMLGTISVTPSPGAAAHPDSKPGPRGPGVPAATPVPSPSTIRGGN